MNLLDTSLSWLLDSPDLLDLGVKTMWMEEKLEEIRQQALLSSLQEVREAYYGAYQVCVFVCVCVCVCVCGWRRSWRRYGSRRY